MDTLAFILSILGTINQLRGLLLRKASREPRHDTKGWPAYQVCRF